MTDELYGKDPKIGEAIEALKKHNAERARELAEEEAALPPLQPEQTGET